MRSRCWREGPLEGFRFTNPQHRDRTARESGRSRTGHDPAAGTVSLGRPVMDDRLRRTAKRQPCPSATSTVIEKGRAGSHSAASPALLHRPVRKRETKDQCGQRCGHCDPRREKRRASPGTVKATRRHGMAIASGAGRKNRARDAVQKTVGRKAKGTDYPGRNFSKFFGLPSYRGVRPGEAEDRGLRALKPHPISRRERPGICPDFLIFRFVLSPPYDLMVQLLGANGAVPCDQRAGRTEIGSSAGG
jgi:hypothetical protein